MQEPTIIVLTLTSGDCALYINGDAVMTLEADEEGKDPAVVGHLSVITGFDVVMVTLRDGELPHERRSALLLEREGALHSGVFKAMPFGCGLRPQP